MSRDRGLRLVVTGQFLGALADSALLVVALQALAERHAPGWQAPALRVLFYGAYVLLAVFSGAVADAFSKRDVLVVTGLVKVGGCALLTYGAGPLAAYAFVGFGAVSHMPARYGILGELVSPDRLVRANAWLEGATLGATLLGVALGSALLHIGQLTPGGGGARPAAAWLLLPYGAAVLCCALLPRARATRPGALRTAYRLPRQFGGVARALLADPIARNAIATTSTLWAAAAVLQFALLRWADECLGLPMAQAVLLQLVVTVGMICGAAVAGRWADAAPLRVVPFAGFASGLAVMGLALVRDLRLAVPLLGLGGLFAGLVLIPMNATVQAGGARARRPGEWLAVQHFAENAGSLALLAAYAAAVRRRTPATEVVLLLGILVALASLATLFVTVDRHAPASGVRAPTRRL